MGHVTNYRVKFVVCQFSKSHTCVFSTQSIIFDAAFFRGSRPEVFCRKGSFRNFAKFTGKHRISFLIKLQASAWKETLAQVFSCEFCKISKKTFSNKISPVAASHFWENKLLKATIFSKTLHHKCLIGS